MATLILDTETTGLPHQEWARVVELGAVVLGINGRILDTFSSLMYPGDVVQDPRAERALAYNRIALVDVLGAPSADTVRHAFRGWMARNGVDEVYAYGRPFDERMLRLSGFELPWAGCVMRMARRAMPRRPKDPPLHEAARYYKIPVTTTHRALDDARLAAGVYAAIRREGA